VKAFDSYNHIQVGGSLLKSVRLREKLIVVDREKRRLRNRDQSDISLLFHPASFNIFFSSLRILKNECEQKHQPSRPSGHSGGVYATSQYGIERGIRDGRAGIWGRRFEWDEGNERRHLPNGSAAEGDALSGGMGAGESSGDDSVKTSWSQL
jgi:hypothetical protein